MIQKPWGHEKILRKTNSYVVKEIYVKPNSRLSLQYHNKKIETIFLVEGEGWLETHQFHSVHGEQEVEFSMCLMEPYYVGRGLKHRLFTLDKDCLVIEVSSTELDDVVRVEDDYGRAQF